MASLVNDYASCSTVISTAAKTASISGFILASGSLFGMNFINGNSAANPTLNVNNTGAKALFSGNSAAGNLPANFKALIQYDGTNYNILNYQVSNSSILVNGILKGDGSGNISAAIPNTDYTTPAALSGGLATKTTAQMQMTGYTMPSSTSAVVATDTINSAIGKLEKGLQNAGNGGGGGGDNGFSDWQNVKAFGAKGDGITDDTTAIQAAINAGNQVYFPSGTYIVNQLSVSNANDIVLWGYGATLKKKAGSATWTRILDISSTDTLKILGLTFDGNKPNVAGSPQQGCGSIWATDLTNFLFSDLKICNSYYGVDNLIDCHYGNIVNCIFDDIDVGILGMNIANSYITIDNCTFTNGTSEGISFGIYTAITPADFTRFGYHDHIMITNCRFLNKNANCIQLRNVKNVFISNNYLERTDSTKATTGIVIDPDAVAGVDIVPDNVIIQSNLIKGMRFEGILVTKGINILIKDNDFDSIQSFNITAKCACIIKNNIFANIRPGVQTIYVQINNVKILDNYFKLDSVSVPCVIRISSATAGIEVIDNVLSKSSTNTSPGIAYSNSSPSAVIISGNYGF